MSRSTLPEWADWHPSAPYTVGIEEEVMLLDPRDWALAQRIDDVLPRLSPGLAAHVTPETHGAAIELATSPNDDVAGAAQQLADLRASLAGELAGCGLRVASAGTHPFAMWTETQVSSGARYQLVYGSMRELARREPTFALHVHIGVADPDAAITLHNRLRAHLPLLLALSANSPFWQGRDSGLASARTPLFQAFPRVGIPRAFTSYGDYAETVDLFLRCQAIPEPTFLWWDVRPQARFGTVEVRVMDAQATVVQTGALVALVQSIAHLELEEGYHAERLIDAGEILAENRFLAARDGMDAHLIDPVAERRVPARTQLATLLESVRPHAADLGCEDALEPIAALGREAGAAQQLKLAREHEWRGGGASASGLSGRGERERLAGLVECLADSFVDGSVSSSLVDCSVAGPLLVRSVPDAKENGVRSAAAGRT
ncbi:MAG: carboxylate-amine ligase [Solirubrobacteraceae bacterium]